MNIVDPDTQPLQGEVKASPDSPYYRWTCNQHAHFVVFRWAEAHSIGIRATIKPLKEGGYSYHVTAPDWWTGDGWTGEAKTLQEAQTQANFHLNKIVDVEFKFEYVHPFG